MKRMHKSMGGVILLGILPWAYAYSLGSSVPASSTPATPPSPGGTHPIEALDQNIVQLLTQIQSQLQTITSQQSQMQQSFQGYTQFEIMSAYPSSSYWKFNGWSGDCTNPSGICVLNVNSNKIITPSFILRLFNYKEF